MFLSQHNNALAQLEKVLSKGIAIMKASLFLLAVNAAAGLGASLQSVASFGSNPTKINMYIYVPDKLATKPAVIVAVS